MNRRAFLGAAAAASTAAPLPAQQSPSPRTNVLMILADDIGYECLGCYGGGSYRTPNLDRLAGQGVRFNHGYAQPLCTPTRVQLMTGLYNNRNWKAFGILDPAEVTFGPRLRKAGYRTVMAGKWQMYSYNPPGYEPEWRGKGMLAEKAGFDEYNVWHALHTEDKGSRYGDPTYLRNGQLFDRIKDEYGDDVWSSFILDFMERHRSEPTFAYYPMALTHGPFNPTPRSADWHTKRLKNDPVYFKDMVEYMDDVVGRMQSRLEKLGLAERTLVMFFGDNGTDQAITSSLHGQPYKGGKGLTTDAGTRVPMLAWGAGVQGGRVLDDLVDSTDFLPTILAAAGEPSPRDVKLDGVSFLPQLRGQKTKAARDHIFCWHDPRPGWDKEAFTLQIFARDQRWKLYSDGRLFDIPADQLELHPIAGKQDSPESAAARKKLRARLQRYRA